MTTTQPVTVTAFRSRQHEHPVHIGAHEKATIESALLYYGGQPGAGTFKRPRIEELYHRIRTEPLGSGGGEYELSLGQTDVALIDDALVSYGQNEIRRQNASSVRDALHAALTRTPSARHI